MVFIGPVTQPHVCFWRDVSVESAVMYVCVLVFVYDISSGECVM